MATTPKRSNPAHSVPNVATICPACRAHVPALVDHLADAHGLDHYLAPLAPPAPVRMTEDEYHTAAKAAEYEAAAHLDGYR